MEGTSEKNNWEERLKKMVFFALQVAVARNFPIEVAGREEGVKRRELMRLLGRERERRVQEMWEIQKKLSCFDEEGTKFKSNKENLILPNTFEKEITQTIEKLKAEFLKNNFQLPAKNKSETQKIIMKISVITNLKRLLPIFKINDEEINQLVNHLYNLLEESQTLDDYIRNYSFFALLGDHNNEIGFKEGTVDVEEENGNTFTLPKKGLETSIKQVTSVNKKTMQGVEIKDMKDLYRFTILVDDLFEDIDYIEILNDSNSKEDYTEGIKQQKIERFGAYLKEKISFYKEQGYGVNVDIKVYESGYSDATITLSKKNNAGRIEKYEIQLQTKQTLEHKEKETKENDIRKDIISEIYQTGDKVFDCIAKINKNDLGFKIRKYIESLFFAGSDHQITDFTSITNETNSLSGNPIRTKPDTEENPSSITEDSFIGEVVKNLENQVLESKVLENQENLTKICHEIAVKLSELRLKMLQSLARSKIWYSQGSFVQTGEDIQKIKEFVGECEECIESKIKKSDKDFSQINPEFGKDYNETLRVILFNEKGYVLLVKKTQESKNPGALQLPGGNIVGLGWVLEEAKAQISKKLKGFRNLTFGESCGSFCYLNNNPEDDKNSPTIVSIIPGEVRGIITANTNPEHKVEENVHEVPWDEFIRGCITGYLKIGEREFRLNRNSRLPAGALFELNEFGKTANKSG
jgi:hypothetical protein